MKRGRRDNHMLNTSHYNISLMSRKEDSIKHCNKMPDYSKKACLLSVFDFLSFYLNCSRKI